MQRFLANYTSKVRTPLIILGALLSIVGATTGIPQTVSAVAPVENMSLDNQIKSLLYYRAVGTCLQNASLVDNGYWANRINESNADKPMWFGYWTGSGLPSINASEFFLGPYFDKNADNAQCGSGAGGIEGIAPQNSQTPLLKDALSVWGYSSGSDALCAFGFLRVDYNDSKKCTDAQGGSGKDFYRNSGSESNKDFQSAIKKKLYDNKDPYASDAAWYKFYWTVFSNTCGAGKMDGVPKSSATGEYGYTLKQISLSADGKYLPSDLHILGVLKKTDIVDTRQGSVTNNDKVSRSCQQIAEHINNYAGAYQSYMVLDSQKEKPNEGDKECLSDSSCETSTTSCAVEGVGWIVCPVLIFLGDIADKSFGFLSTSFLQTNPGLVGQDTYTAWTFMRNIANVAFVIVFLIIIFSQLSNVGITNYGVKKMLPRLIVAAILVNLSFFICQVAVDFSNILGKSLYDVFGFIPVESSGTGDGSTHAGGWVVLITALIAGGIGLAFAISVPVLLAALVAILMIALILVLRIALIVLLTVISPLAFVAYLLPNTEQWFKKWAKVFSGLLLVYPVIAIVFGASALAAQIINNVSATAEDAQVLQAIAMGVAAIPFFVVPSLLKNSMSAAGSIGTKLAGWSSKANGRIGGKVNDTSRLGQYNKYRQGEANKRRALIQGGAYEGKGGKLNPRNWASRTNKAINNSRLSGKFGDRSAAAGIGIANKAEAEEIGFAEQILRRDSIADPSAAKNALQRALVKGDAVQAKAAQNVLFTQGGSGMKNFHDAVTQTAGANASTVSALRENINTNHGQMVKAKAIDISKWAAVGGNLVDIGSTKDTWQGMSQADLAGQTGDSMLRGVAAGGINGETAAELLNNAQLSGNLDDKQRAALQQAASQGASNNEAYETYNVATPPASEATFKVDRSGEVTPADEPPIDYFNK